MFDIFQHLPILSLFINLNALMCYWVDSLVSGLFDMGTSGINAYANHREAKLQREWQERMYKNQLQYRVEDAKAAGINPIFAAGNLNTSVPSGGMAPGNPVSFNNTAKSLLLLQKQAAEKTVEKADAEIGEINSRTNLNNAQVSKVFAETSQIPTLSPLEVNRLARGKNAGIVGKAVNDTISSLTYLFDAGVKTNETFFNSTKSMIKAKLESEISRNGNNSSTQFSEAEIDEMAHAAAEKIEKERERERKTIMEGARRYGYPVWGRITP